MCIVADSVADISKTKIACFHIGCRLNNNTNVVLSQLVVYSANVDSIADNNALILPVYNPGNNYKNIIPLDFSNFPDFFDQIDAYFSRWFPEQKSKSYTNSTNLGGDQDFLPVHQVGDYKFSIMPSKMDFNKIDRNILRINPLAKIAIDSHSNDYSFIVYQFFQKGHIDITPFAYVCKPYDKDSMIIPTIHGHPHPSNIFNGFDRTNHYHPISGTEFEQTADFDHEIYCISNNSNAKNITRKKDLDDFDHIIKKITTDYMNRKIRIYAPKSFIPGKIKIKGDKPNRNLFVKQTKYDFLNDLVIDKNF